MQHNHTPEKYEKICAGEKKAFIVPQEWSQYAAWAKQNLLNMIEQE